MFARMQQEEEELRRLAPEAMKARQSRGRRFPEEECDYRTGFQRDRDRIIHSKAFRRLKHKTQVFIAPEGDHYRTRLTHTLEVAQIARTIARLLRLNEDLTEAIALGHELGHTPFGHAGEEGLNQLVPGGFRHEDQSLRVVDLLEPYHLPGAGLNLTWEVRDGIRNHTGSGESATREGEVVYLADRIAYINHDIDDAIRAGVLHPADLPADCLEVLGHSHSQRISRMIQDIVKTSSGGGKVRLSPEVGAMVNKLRSFLYQQVYTSPRAKAEEAKLQDFLGWLYQFYLKNPQELPPLPSKEEDSLERKAADYLAGMTDHYAIADFQRRFVPRVWMG
ncbi:MAG: deoxyguanosinetriphosphate triphosphohydrolase [Firmicutes bacterium]|nr:deoxyguanosinetriphosphate triphosphohydrolase [Bacillota bacterium]